MLVREFGILFEELGCRDQVPSDPVRVLLAERLQFGASTLVEVARLDALGNLRGIVVPESEIRGPVPLARRIIGTRARAVVATPVAVGLAITIARMGPAITVAIKLAVTVRLPVAVTRLRPSVAV